MTQEEKAKAYEEAIKIAKEELKEADAIEYNLPDCAHAIRTTVYSLFPDLKESESEDERIRKALKEYFINSFQINGVAAICGVHIKDILAWLEKQGEQKPAWSEEDEKILNLIIARLHSHPNVEVEEYGKDYHWLNSLENRVQPQPKQEWSLKKDAFIQVCVNAINDISYFRSEDKEELINWLNSLRPQSQLKWSEEDEETLKDIITSMTNLKDSATSDALRYIYNSKIAWLKSLIPQSQWRPSDEQMKALDSVLDYLANNLSNLELINDLNFLNLQSLYKELKKLTE